MSATFDLRTTSPVEFEQEQLDRVTTRLQPLILRLTNATVPLCQLVRRGLVTPAGSGVLLQIEDRRYLVSASHVFENAVSNKPIAAIAGNRFITVSSERRWRTKQRVEGVPDRADLAVVQFAIKSDEYWLGTSFIGLGDVDPLGTEIELAPTTSFMALGYPRSKQPKVLQNGAYAAFAYHFLTHRESPKPESPFVAVPDQHIAVGYDRRGFVGAPGVSEMAKPDGMSGGGLWRIPFAITAKQPQAHLVGILIEHHAGPKLILASRIAEALRFLRTLDAANATAIAASFPDLDAPAT